MPSSVPVAEIALDPPTSEERNHALVLWLLNLFIHILGPWIYWRYTGRQSAFVAHHFQNCVNHVLTVLILLLIVCIVFAAPTFLVLYAIENVELALGLTIGLLAAMVLGFLALGAASAVIHVIAAMKALAGEWWTPPLCWRMTKIAPKAK